MNLHKIADFIEMCLITYEVLVQQKMKVYPVTHPRHGQPTYFKEKFEQAQAIQKAGKFPCVLPHPDFIEPKYHTIRGNYELWEKRFEKIMRGEACLSVRVWAGVPYRSDQRVICNLGKDDGIGLQLLQFHEPGKTFTWVGEPHVDGKRVGVAQFANNDGLTVEDWIRWLTEAPKSDLTQDFALIQLTDFRYN